MGVYEEYERERMRKVTCARKLEDAKTRALDVVRNIHASKDYVAVCDDIMDQIEKIVSLADEAEGGE